MGLIVDNFAGGGGASLGLERAFGRPVDIAINHSAEAIAMHKANHPHTHHIQQNIYQVDPAEIRRRGHIDLAWFSPDCTHHSKAKGGAPIRTPEQRSSRDLAWVVVQWAERARPDVILLENVEEFEDWGPLREDGKPCPDQKGFTFKRWVKALRRAGYKVEWRELRACDYGAPTIRKRLFLVARCDGLPICWPAPTHAAPTDPRVISGELLAFRTAAECIDWSIPCPSIFMTQEEGRAMGLRVKRPLADNTLARIARGMQRFVIDNPNPFIVNLTHGGRVETVTDPFKTITGAHRGEKAVVEPYIVPVTHTKAKLTGNSTRLPLRTVTTAKGGEFALVAPFVSRQFGQSVGSYADMPLGTVTAGGGGKSALVAPTLIQTGYGERPGQAPRSLNLHKPLGTVVAGGQKHALVAAWMVKHFGGMTGVPVDQPGPTTTTRGTQNQIVTSYLTKYKGTSKDGQPVDEPLHTVQAGGLHYAEVRAFLLKYYGTATGQDPRDPLHSVTTKDRIGVVTIAGEDWRIADIGMRMLSARELFLAQGFDEDYIIDPEFNGKALTKTAAVSCCGNSVNPNLAEALARANAPASLRVAA